MRHAIAGLTIVRGHLGPRSLASGLRSKDSRAVRRGPGEKGPCHLARGLPYGTHGFETEMGGAIPSSTVTGRALRRENAAAKP